MAGWFSRKQKTTTTDNPTTVLPLGNLNKRLQEPSKITDKHLADAKLQIQKLIEKEEGLRYIISQTDSTEAILTMRKNAIAELLEEEITVLQEELALVNQVAEDLNKSRYEELLQRATKQEKVDENLFNSTQSMMLGDEANDSTRKDLVRKVKQSGSEYKKLASAYNKKVDGLKILLGNSNMKLIESERAHVATLINMLESHLTSLNKIKNQMEGNPNLEKVNQTKQHIKNMLAKYDARTESARLNEIRAENTEAENNLNRFFKESGAIEDLHKQIEAKAYEIKQISTELRANTSLLVF